MRVSALAPYPSPAPSTYFRLEQFLEPFASRGIELDVQPFVAPDEYQRLYSSNRWHRARLLLGGWRRRARLIESGALSPVVIVQRELAPAGAHRLLGKLIRTGRTLVFDFDDAVYLKSPGGEPLLRWMRDAENCAAELCRSSSAVWPGNEELARFARKNNPNATTVVPTVVDTDLYHVRRREGNDPPVIGWVGSHTSLPYLEALLPVLRALRERVPFKLKVVCNRAPASSPPNLDLEFEPWEPTRRVAAVQTFDIGVYPLADDPWARGKCGLKAIEYGACGLPVVCPPVGVLSEVVRDGVTGFHVHSEIDWCDQLERLLRDADLRRQLGEAGRSLVERSYSVASIVDRLAEDLRALSQGGR